MRWVFVLWAYIFVVILLTTLLLSAVTDTFTLQGVMVGSSDLGEQLGYRDANLHIRLYTVETTMITTQKTYKNTHKSPLFLYAYAFSCFKVIV